MSYGSLNKELSLMENNPGTVRFLDLRNYSKQLDSALAEKKITKRQHDLLDERFMKL